MPRVPLILVLGVLLLPLTGCLTTPAAPPPDPAAPDPEGPTHPTTGGGRVALVAYRNNLQGAEFDFQCATGGKVGLDRIPGARVAPGTSHLEVRVTSPPTNTGLQVGWALDEAEPQWLPVVFADEATQQIPVPPEALENETARWTFYYQLNLQGAEQKCYTGAGTGERAITIEAIPSTT
ncbi:MAG TPA: hypothetical protein VNZ52_04220 [Candidatus Thermoplasmatota archaeon]|nr:hypothetical protein [Candidatus Thermoplasmatota archaeon]